MKKKLLILLATVVVATLSANGQDVITKTDGTELQATVTEIGTNEVKYTRYGTTSPIYSIAKSEIFMIRYQDGTKDVLNVQSSNSQVSSTQIVLQDSQTANFKKNSFGLDLGIGVATLSGYTGFGSSIGLRWLHRFNEQLGWNIINAKLNVVSMNSVAIVTMQLMTGIHYIMRSNEYIDVSIGYGGIGISDGQSTISGNILAFEIGTGWYLSKTFSLGGFYNVSLDSSGSISYFELRAGWNF